MNEKELRTAIGIAFPIHPLPREMDITYDTTGDHLECEQIRSDFRNRVWTGISRDEVAMNRQSLFFLSPVGYQYLLPAFLVAVLDAPRDSLDIVNSLMTSVLPAKSLAANALGNRQLAQLTPAQREVFRDFLVWAAENLKPDIDLSDIKTALRTLG